MLLEVQDTKHPNTKPQSAFAYLLVQKIGTSLENENKQFFSPQK